jgi:hypothetical protein
MAPQVALMIKAISDAQSVLATHLAAEHPDAKVTVNSLLGLLDVGKLVAAVRAMAASNGAQGIARSRTN